MKAEEFIKKYVKAGKILKNNVKVIIGNLNLSNSKIKKLENLPEKIYGCLFLENNKIKKLENLPSFIAGNLNLYKNKITDIENLPNIIRWGIDLEKNPIFKKIKTFEDAKNYVMLNKRKKIKENLKDWSNL